MKTVFQCEVCARNTRDGKWIVRKSNSKTKHYVCGRCEREGDTNWFVRRQIETLEQTKRLVDLGSKVFWAKRGMGVRGDAETVQ